MTRSGRFLIISWDGGGNTPSALNLGARLVVSGHRVRLMGWDSMAARAAAAGLEFARYPSVPPPPKDQSLDVDWDALSKVVLHGRGARDDILAQAKEFEPDVLVLDCMMGAGFDAAGILGIPTAVLVHVMYGPFRYEWGGMMLGIDVGSVLDSAGAVLALTPPGLDAPCNLPPNTAYVGPISNPTLQEALQPQLAEILVVSGDPWVLLSLGTTLQGQAKAIPPILDALATMSVQRRLDPGGRTAHRGVLRPAERDRPGLRSPRAAFGTDACRHLARRTQHRVECPRGRCPPLVHSTGSRATHQCCPSGGHWRRKDAGNRRLSVGDRHSTRADP